MDSSNQKLYLVGYAGELSIKGKRVRNLFTHRLAENLANALDSHQIPHEIEPTWSRLFVRSPSADVVEVAQRVFGVQWVSSVEERTWSTLDDLLQQGEEIFAPLLAGKTFAVRARRGPAAQKIPFRSPELERKLGSRLDPLAAGVDLRSPQVTARVELKGPRAFFFSESQPGPGGLPLGTEGRALALVSGGFDSLVAAWQLLRRGVCLDYMFCNLGGDTHRDRVLEVLKVLSDRWSYGYRPKIHMVDFRPVVEELQAVCPQSLWQVILKRQMLRAADHLARMTRAIALITGEAVGQVSSQTLHNLAIISQATQHTILRPLVGANKDDIVSQARRIGTYELSSKVPEYCALAPKNPESHAKPEPVLAAEEGLDPELLRALVYERAIVDLRALDLGKMRAPDLEVTEVPSEAVVVDLRSSMAFKAWHYPEAVHLGYREALELYPSFDRKKLYLFYCEVGLKSAHLAELVHRAGGRSCHFKGGLKPLKRLSQEDDLLRHLDSPVLLEPRDGS